MHELSRSGDACRLITGDETYLFRGGGFLDLVEHDFDFSGLPTSDVDLLLNLLGIIARWDQAVSGRSLSGEPQVMNRRATILSLWKAMQGYDPRWISSNRRDGSELGVACLRRLMGRLSASLGELSGEPCVLVLDVKNKNCQHFFEAADVLSGSKVTLCASSTRAAQSFDRVRNRFFHMAGVLSGRRYAPAAWDAAAEFIGTFYALHFLAWIPYPSHNHFKVSNFEGSRQHMVEERTGLLHIPLGEDQVLMFSTDMHTLCDAIEVLGW